MKCLALRYIAIHALSHFFSEQENELQSSPMSSQDEVWVGAPVLIRSTPLLAIAEIFFSVIPPDASKTTSGDISFRNETD